MSAFVVDVNVPVVANGRTPHADLGCISACVSALERIADDGVVVLDDGMAILSEYMRNLSLSGQPGLGDAFMQWVWENQAVSSRCERVTLDPAGPGGTRFAEFPKDPALSGFHDDDRKYVAAARASKLGPHVLNAVDPDWWDYRDALARNGVQVEFLCPQHMVCGKYPECDC